MNKNPMMQIRVQAIALHSSLSGGREPVQIEISGTEIKISGAEHLRLPWSIPLSETRIFLGGNEKSLLFLEHPALGDVKIYSEFSGELKKYVLTQESLQQKLSADLKDRRKSHIWTWSIALGLISAIVLIVLFRAQIFSPMAHWIPFSIEKKMADQVFAKRQKTAETPDIPPGNPADLMLKEWVDPLLDEHWRKLLTFHLSSGKEINAYATFGGHIFIKRGLVEALKTPEQLLGVIAHEMVHAQERHVTKSVIQGLGLFALIQAFFGDLTGIAAVLVDQSGPLLMLQHSRELETEADRLATNTLLKANISPRGLPEALRILHQESQKLLAESGVDKVAEKLNQIELWSTHPEMDRRIRELEDLIEQKQEDLQKVKPLPGSYTVFVDLVRQNY